MTAQGGEIIAIDGTHYELLSLPLEPYLHALSKPIDFEELSGITSTALLRGYRGHWSLRAGLLYLDALETAHDGEFFDVLPTPLLASWFTGKLRVQSGKCLFFYAGFARVHEYERIIHVHRGRITRERHVDMRALWEKLAKRHWDFPDDIQRDLIDGKLRLQFMFTAKGFAQPIARDAADIDDDLAD